MRVILMAASVLLTSLPLEADVHVTMDRYACVAEPTSQTGLAVDFYGDVSNTGTSAVSLTCKLATSQPQEWLPPGVCIGVSCFPSDMEFTVELPPNSQDEIHLTFYPYDSAGKGIYWFRFAHDAMADSARMEVLSGVPSLLVDDDDGDASETFVERALPADRAFLTWSQDLEPLASSDVALLERIMWITGGSPAGCLSQDEADVLTALLESGGKVLLSGQNALEGEVGAEFGQGELGATVEAASVDSRHIQGAAGTSFEIVSFDIAGGDGADNQTSPDVLAANGTAFRALRYGSGEVSAVARVGLAGRRSLACGFGVEACADSTVLEGSLDLLLDWLDGLVAGDNAPRERPLALRVRPNPTGGVITVDLSAPEGGIARIWLTDLSGRLAGELHHGVWSARPLRLPRLPRGTYLLCVETPTHAASQPLVILEETR
ncbi:MAG: hypothetical protein MUE60_11300 [Candidatus Eisenbacteria bacterium]|nr:hypothetical protein [Candidatus Eisenbacteria bacterium]